MRHVSPPWLFALPALYLASHSYVSHNVSEAGAETALPPIPAVAAPGATSLATIRSVEARVEGAKTLLDIVVRGKTSPALKEEKNRLVVTLPNAAADPQLGAHIASGGLVSGIALDAPAGARDTRIALELVAPSHGEIVKGPDDKTIRVQIAVVPKEAPAVAVKAAGKRLYDVDAYQSDVAGLLKSLARDAGVSIVLTGTISGKVTADLRQVPIEKAIDLLTKSAGLAYHRDGDTFVVGAQKDLDAAYPRPAQDPVKPAEPVIRQEIFRCRYVAAADVVSALEKMFDKSLLKCSLGAAPSSPKLGDTQTETVTGIQAAAKTATTTTEPGRGSRDVLLCGEAGLVERALAMAAQMDVRRTQVRISVQIADVNLTALKELGITWNWSDYSVKEATPNGINFGSFTHDPVSITAQINALQKNDRAKLLASPTLSLLDNERGFILIGDRLQFPKLIGYTQAQTPIFDKDEVRVGIYLQVAVETAPNGEITLTLYPQVSTITSFLQVNGASYPQISTREQQTTIRVKDGQPIVVGGLIQDSDIVNVQSVPILSKIPFFGELFTFRRKSKERSEVVITITPQILKD